jgi:predicted secreted hydrolase
MTLPPPLVHLPADQASHPRAHNEWWYVVGHVRSGARTFGYEATIFRISRLRVPGLSAPVSLLRTDIAITDEANHRFLQHVSYYFPQSGKLSTSTLHVQVGTTTLQGPSPRNMSLQTRLPGGAIHLHLSSHRKPMYVGGRGYIPFGNAFSYYYSLTALASSGTITIGKTSYQVDGISWLDHQWGNWNWQTIRGWTWMALQLDNGTQLSVFDFRSTVKRVKAASVLLANGTLRTVYGLSIEPSGTWLSPHTHARYPSGWIVHIPALKAILHVAPTVRDQEVVAPGGHEGTYWEGSGRITGSFAAKPVSGYSYTELTGYAGGFAG